MRILFVSDLHGRENRYRALFHQIKRLSPDVVLLGGDLLPHLRRVDFEDFIKNTMVTGFQHLKNVMKKNYPFIGLILGNDDPRAAESMIAGEEYAHLWTYLHQKKVNILGHDFYGYSFVPPTPFLLKDWEKYDVSRFVDPGCVPPVEGFRTANPDYDIEFSTIAEDLDILTKNQDVSSAVFLFHSPPYKTFLDRAALDGKMIDHVPLDVHVGSIAIRRFIESRQPLITLHGHIHESTDITGHFSEKLGRTWMFNAANHTHKLAVVLIDTDSPEQAKRLLYD